MKKFYPHISLSCFVLLGMILAVCPASALDITVGGDALYHQLYSNPIVVAAKLSAQTTTSSSFTLVKQMSGKNMPAAFSVPLSDDFLKGYNFVNGQTYLLFLRANILRPMPRFQAPTFPAPERPFPLPEQPRRPIPELPVSYSFASSIYSIQPITDAEVPVLENAVQTYKNNVSDLNGLKAGLKAFAASNSNYLQYSSISDLSQMNLLNAADVNELSVPLSQGLIRHPRAQILLVREIAKNNLFAKALVIEELAKRSTVVSVQVASLDALSDLNAVDSLRRLEPILKNHRSLRIRDRLVKRGPLK